ncbi:PSD1 and planctomycete cytochrome C domain-containing protein [Planctomicrobium sp. SH661]|uniref:PSD1 and planctomycete cytochrome C domain-containing protein n=1 Tax=Planctomicrobium sp. SH661 TaxID=3448124 RepID=UPI003F5AF4CA
MRTTRMRALLGAALLPCLISPLLAETSKTSDVLFEKDVRPILKATCFHCHGESSPAKGGLDLRLARFAIRGGESGPSVVAGNKEESPLFQYVRDGDMPPDKAHRLTPAQVELIGKWIDSGAKTARPEPESITGMLITEEELGHWAYQKVTRPPIPKVRDAERVRTPVDAFLLEKLEEQGFGFSPDAPAAKLIRRGFLDLTGLPPSIEEIAAANTDFTPEKWDQLVEHLLESPHYGERWGRHWLDVAGYSDSDGYTNVDRQRKHAWRYRDYVIRSFNEDKPFDRFILEQLAGDELITSPLENLTPEDVELLTATGFLRMAPDGTGGNVDNPNVAQHDVLAETLKIVTSSLMGLTVGCAQCHDHRHDPIPTRDYYQLRAILEPALNTKQWRTPQQRLISTYTAADREEAARIEAQAVAIEAERKAREKVLIDASFAKELEKLPAEVQSIAQGLPNIPVSERTEEQTALLKQYPALNVTDGSLYLYDPAGADELKKMAERAAEVRKTKPKEHFVHALTEAGEIPTSFVFYRGDFNQPTEEVHPGGLTVVAMNQNLNVSVETAAVAGRSGRRTALARYLTHPDHPLTARVLVNRIWHHHFGRGIVATLSDFGSLGAQPTHPELLDWLASELIDSGWSVKHIHRLIMRSSAYRQSSRLPGELEQVDPENLLYGGAQVRRMDAETLRDSVLTISGALNTTMYGPAVEVIADQTGTWVLGIENLVTGYPGPVIPLNGRENLRSVYVEARRSRPYSVLEPFDMPIMTPNCAVRRTSTGSPQSLMLINSQFILDYSSRFARQLEAAAPGNLHTQIEKAWQLAYCRTPEPSELASAESFIQEQATLLQERLSQINAPGELTPQQRALDSLCQMLLCSNEFLYVD